jgi:heme/copper-type cytochrome/quinol oxidase subunit 2
MPLSKETRLEIFKGLIAIIVGVLLAIFSYYLGRSTGREGKQEGFDKIQTQVNLSGTKWQVSYEESLSPTASPTLISTETKRPNTGKKPVPAPSPAPTPLVKVATVEFKQFGSRIVGTGSDSEGREWIIEGAAAERRVCYIYYDSRGQTLSFGTVLLEMNGWGTEMKGQWVGWSPVSNELQLRAVTLKKL